LGYTPVNIWRYHTKAPEMMTIELRQMDGKNDERQNMGDEWRCTGVGDLVF